MRHSLSISAVERPARRLRVDPVLLALAAPAVVILAVEAAVIVYAAPMLDPLAPLYTT